MIRVLFGDYDHPDTRGGSGSITETIGIGWSLKNATIIAASHIKDGLYDWYELASVSDITGDVSVEWCYAREVEDGGLSPVAIAAKILARAT